MHPVLVEGTQATSMASTPTFLINPGFVYAFGFSAFVSLSIPLVAGIVIAISII